MSDDQNLVSPEPPTTCTISGQVMHWDGRQWTHPSGEGCELKTHLSSDPVTAPELVGIIAAALFEVRDDAFDEDTWEEIDGTDREEYECQARAVLAALTEAGTVEWGVAWKGAGPSGVLAFDSEEDAREAVELGGLLSRLTFPWGRAE